jgi:hypothetical protein
MMYSCKSKEYTSPLEKGDHPEVDTSEKLDKEGIKKYQTMIGCLQWAVSLERFDIQTATMMMSRFRANLRKGHLERLKRIYGYLKRFQVQQNLMNQISPSCQIKNLIGVTRYIERSKSLFQGTCRRHLVSIYHSNIYQCKLVL